MGTSPLQQTAPPPTTGTQGSELGAAGDRCEKRGSELYCGFSFFISGRGDTAQSAMGAHLVKPLIPGHIPASFPTAAPNPER